MTLFLQFEVSKDRYLLEAGQVTAVLVVPLLKQLPGAPAGIAGVMNYQGHPVPVLDLSMLALGQPAPERMSTRLILVRYPYNGGEKRLGLIAERVTRVERLKSEAFTNTGVNQAPWLGSVCAVDTSMAQQVRVEDLLSPEVRESLFARVEEAGL